MEIYLDNASTTKVSENAIKAINNCLYENYGNPSSLHGLGIKAQKTIDNTRKIIAQTLSCDFNSIYFTSGATESNNLAILGTIKSYGVRKKRIVTTSIEHPSVMEPLNYIQKQGFEVVKIKPNKNGEIDPNEFCDAVNENTCMVSVMLVNNETGYILPIRKIFNKIKKNYPNVITHCDAVQGFLKIPIKIKDINADIISISGHKVHSAKGIGAIYVKKGIRVSPINYGGKQEKGIRSGTESVPLIAGFGAAINEMNKNIIERFKKADELREYLIDKIKINNDIIINSNNNCSPYIINISVMGIRSEIMLHFLEQKGIYISSGSACSKGAKSNVLKEFGLNNKQLDSALRISTSYENTNYDIKMLVDAIEEGQQKLIHSN